MTTKTIKDNIVTGLPFVGGLTVGTLIGHPVSKHSKTLAWLVWSACAAFGLGWSISLANKSSATGTSAFSLGNVSAKACTKPVYEALLARRAALSTQMEGIKSSLDNPNLGSAQYAQLVAQYNSVKSQLQAVATAICRCEAGFITSGNIPKGAKSSYSAMPGTIEVRL